jgi:O-antigen/teichoic acid export membrane protein
MALMNSVKLLIKSTLSSPRARQASFLYTTMVISLVLGIAVSVINTRLLGPEQFGEFKLLQTVWIVGVLCCTFGLFTTGGNLLTTKKKPEAERPLLGGLLVIAALISLVILAMMMFASFPLGHLYGDAFGMRVRLYSGLLFVFPLQIYLRETLRGTNNIYRLAFLGISPQLAYIPVALVTNYLFGFSLDIAIIIYLLSLGATVLIIVFLTKPNFSHIGDSVREIMGKNRVIGSHIYIASLVTTTTGYLGLFTLGYFQDSRQVGEFALAITITMPLAMVPNALATTFFKHFSSARTIPTKVIVVAAVSSLLTLAGFLLIIKTLILLLYTESFAGVIPLAYICAVGGVVHGMGDVFNRFLLANGRTSLLRINALQLGVVSTLGYIFLVSWYGSIGAASTKLVVAVLYLASMLTYYLRLIKTKEHDLEPQS